MSKDREHKVKINKFYRPTNLSFLARMDKVLNFAAMAREIDCPKPTFVSRVNRHTDLTKSVEQKAFAEETGEMLNEMWYIIGVGIGKIPKDPHKKFKHFYNDDSERLKDKLTELEELAEGK